LGRQQLLRRSTHALEGGLASSSWSRRSGSSHPHTERCNAVLEPPGQAGVTMTAYGIRRRDHGWLVVSFGVPQTPEASPIWGSDIQNRCERGGWKREADQAPGGGDGVPVGPGLCRWGSRALVITGGPTLTYEENS
jgi:hypothetical protein